MRRSATLLVLCSVVIPACGGSPTAPSATLDAAPILGVTSPAADTSPLAMRSLTGRATNALTGAGAGLVTIRIADVGDIAADPDGNFALESEAPDGRPPGNRGPDIDPETFTVNQPLPSPLSRRLTFVPFVP